MRTGAVSMPIKTTSQNIQSGMPFPAWRLPNGINKASDGDLERSASSCESWAIVSGLLVVFGLIVEAIIAFVHPSYDSPVGTWTPFIADTLVALGVAGEVLFSMMSSRRHNELRVRSNTNLADAITQAGEANQKAEEAQLARLELEKSLSSRRLTGEQSSKLTSALSGVKAQIPELQISRLGDKESHDFANDIIESVEEPRISVEIADIETSEFLRPHGLTLSDTPDGLLRAAFESAGITISDSANTNARPIIFVGLKPPPF
jgi:hypothetical protein